MKTYAPLLLLLLFAFSLAFFYTRSSIDQAELDDINATLVYIVPNKTLTAINASKIFQNRCEPCHGTMAENHALSKSEIINTWSKERIEKALFAYKRGERNHAGMGKMMHGQTNSLSDEEIQSLSNYIPTLK